MARVYCIGHAVNDYIFRVDRMPTAATKYRATGFEMVGGGPAATAAVAIARLGGKAALASRVGDDAIGELIVAELLGEGVECGEVRRMEHRASAVSAVIIDKSGERMIVSCADPQMPQGADWLPDRLPDGTGAVLGDSHWPQGAAKMFALARAAGVPAVLDGGAVWTDDSAHRAATHLAFSSDGLKRFSGDGDPRTLLKRARGLTGAWCCVTEGRMGVLIDDGVEQRRIPGFKVDVVDTLGAGDVWHGAFALALAEGKGEFASATFATGAAALKVTQGGAAPRRSRRVFARQNGLLGSGGRNAAA